MNVPVLGAGYIEKQITFSKTPIIIIIIRRRRRRRE